MYFIIPATALTKLYIISIMSSFNVRLLPAIKVEQNSNEPYSWHDAEHTSAEGRFQAGRRARLNFSVKQSAVDDVAPSLHMLSLSLKVNKMVSVPPRSS